MTPSQNESPCGGLRSFTIFLVASLPPWPQSPSATPPAGWDRPGWVRSRGLTWRGLPTSPTSWEGTHSAHPFGELAFLDEAPACALRSPTVVARTGHAEDVADHHVVMPRNVLPQLAQKVVLLDAAWSHERADVVPVRTVQRHHRPIPTEADDMAVLAQLDEIDQLHRTLADLQCLIHVERVHDHRGVLQPQRVQRPEREGPPQLAGFGCPP